MEKQLTPIKAIGQARLPIDTNAGFRSIVDKNEDKWHIAKNARFACFFIAFSERFEFSRQKYDVKGFSQMLLVSLVKII